MPPPHHKLESLADNELGIYFETNAPVSARDLLNVLFEIDKLARRRKGQKSLSIEIREIEAGSVWAKLALFAGGTTAGALAMAADAAQVTQFGMEIAEKMKSPSGKLGEATGKLTRENSVATTYINGPVNVYNGPVTNYVIQTSALPPPKLIEDQQSVHTMRRLERPQPDELVRAQIKRIGVQYAEETDQALSPADRTVHFALVGRFSSRKLQHCERLEFTTVGGNVYTNIKLADQDDFLPFNDMVFIEGRRIGNVAREIIVDRIISPTEE